MRDRLNKTHAYDPFSEVGEPDIQYNLGKKDLRIYFIDNYPFKQETLEQRLLHVHTDPNKFYVMLEKEIYDLVPEFYSEQSLSLQCDFYGNVTRKNLRSMMLGGLIVGLIGTYLLSISFIPNILISGLLGLFLAVIYMIVYLNSVFQKNLTKGRESLRNGLIDLFGEKRLDEMNALQEKYMERREEEIAKIKEEREKLEKEEEE